MFFSKQSLLCDEFKNVIQTVKNDLNLRITDLECKNQLLEEKIKLLEQKSLFQKEYGNYIRDQITYIEFKFELFSKAHELSIQRYNNVINKKNTELINDTIQTISNQDIINETNEKIMKNREKNNNNVLMFSILTLENFLNNIYIPNDILNLLSCERGYSYNSIDFIFDYGNSFDSHVYYKYIWFELSCITKIKNITTFDFIVFYDNITRHDREVIHGEICILINGNKILTIDTEFRQNIIQKQEYYDSNNYLELSDFEIFFTQIKQIEEYCSQNNIEFLTSTIKK